MKLNEIERIEKKIQGKKTVSMSTNDVLKLIETIHTLRDIVYYQHKEKQILIDELRAGQMI
jgi:hypothetical protein